VWIAGRGAHRRGGYWFSGYKGYYAAVTRDLSRAGAWPTRVAPWDLQRSHRQRERQQRQRASHFRTALALSLVTDPAVLRRQLESPSPDCFSPHIHIPSFVDSGNQIAAAVASQGDAANMIFQPLVTESEAATECLNLRRFDESRASKRSEVVVIGANLPVGRRGDEYRVGDNFRPIKSPASRLNFEDLAAGNICLRRHSFEQKSRWAKPALAASRPSRSCPMADTHRSVSR
jgi:hypothetical protein